MSAPKQLPIDRLVETFRACLIALIPHVEAVGLRSRDGEAYDWDRIEEVLFKSVISTPVEFTPSEGASRPLGRYKFDNDPASCSSLFDEELGEAYEFFGLEQVNTPFNTARFQPKEGEDILKPVAECRFRVRLRSSRSADTALVPRAVPIELTPLGGLQALIPARGTNRSN